MNNRVSVIMPAYNAAQFISEAIESALAQSHKPHEVIVVDDGSNDVTPSIVKSFGAPVRLYQQQNGGPGKARNFGASHATGDWLAFLDADDVWLPEKTEKQLTACQPGDGLVYCDTLNFGQLGGLTEKHSTAVALHQGEVYELLLSQGNFVTLSSAMIRRDVFNVVGGFDERQEIVGVEDWHLWIKAAQHSTIRLCPEVLVRYRCHGSGVSKRTRAMFRAKEIVLDEQLHGKSSSLVRSARANSAGGSAWFARNQREFLISIKLVLRAIRFEPFQPNRYKEFIKCLIRRP